MITILLSVALAGECDIAVPCGTGHAFDVDANPMIDPDCAALLPVRRAPVPLPARRRGVEKLVRDSFGDFPNTYESDNFVIKWGVNDSRVPMSAVEQLSSGLELSWDLFIDEWGYDSPAGTDDYKFNVYVGNTGSGTPDDLGAGGYYWTDDDGYPMVVVSRSGLESPDYVTTLSSHEFFHAIQDENGAFNYDDVSGWWWEATAMWVERAAFPESTNWASFLYWFVIRPELSVGHFEYPTTGSPEQYHQYGAVIYVNHVAERHGGHELIYQTFERSRRDNTPMSVLQELIDESGGDIETSFGEFTLRNANWDYDAEATIEDWIDTYGGYDVAFSNRTTDVVFTETTDWLPEAEHPPRTYGANYIQVVAPAPSFVVSFEGETDATWHVGVASQTGVVHDSVMMEVTDGVGTLQVDGLDPTSEVWIVVSPTGALEDDGHEYTYRLAVEALEVVEPDEDTRKACGCTSAPSPHLLWLAAPLLIGLRRRR